MNNNTKKANIMTWVTFKKKFAPKLCYSYDILGRQVVQPTMTSIGFTERFIYDISIFDERTPLEILADEIDLFKWTYIIYYPFKHRDGSGKGMQIYYK